MATVTKFEDLLIWQKARNLSKSVYSLTKREIFKEDFRFISQINSSSGSVMDNISEGFEREGNKEFIQFLSISKGSLAELKSQFYRALDRNYISNDEFENLSLEIDGLSNMIKGFINYLKNSEIKGVKFKR